MTVGTTELVLLLVIVVVLFGGRMLPRLARSVSESVRELRHVTKED